MRPLIITVAMGLGLGACSAALAQDGAPPSPQSPPSIKGPKGLEFPVIPEESVVEAAVQRACDLLIAQQEDYIPDPAVGGIPDDQLADWQEIESARLAAIWKKGRGSAREWPYEGVYRVRPDRRIPPGYRVGGSAIACEALLESPGLDDTRRAAIIRSVEFMLDMIDNDDGMQPKSQTNYDVRGWGQAYALKFFLRALETDFFSDKALRARVEKAVPHLIACLKKGQVEGGGWNYAGRGFSPFMTASTLLALFHAEVAGYEVDAEMIDSALAALEKGRDDQVAFAYSGPLRNPEEPMQGASARSAVAELVLFKAGRSSVDQLRKAIDGFFDEENWTELHKRKSQQGTHARPYGVAPYYFFYGHTYAALAVEHLPMGERAPYREAMRGLLWRTIEKNGGWNDPDLPENGVLLHCDVDLVADRPGPSEGQELETHRIALIDDDPRVMVWLHRGALEGDSPMLESPLARPRSAPDRRWWSLLVALLVLLLPLAVVSPALGQDGGGDEPAEEEEAPPEKTDEEREAEAEAARKAKERREKILGLFTATEIKFEDDGRITLSYVFENSDPQLAADWSPKIEAFKKRVRWSRGWEGGTHNYSDDTIVFSEYGTWLHKAVWREVQMDMKVHLATEIFKKGDLIAAVFAWDKGKRMAGCNIGEQCVRLNSALKHSGNPIPRAFPVMHSDESRTFGYKIQEGVLTGTMSGRNTVDTSENKKFLKKFGPGHAGLCWKGDYMKALLIQVTFTGFLDAEWVEKSLK